MPTQRIYTSSSGDIWDLVREEGTGCLYVKHTPNLASGGMGSYIDLVTFLGRNSHSDWSSVVVGHRKGALRFTYLGDKDNPWTRSSAGAQRRFAVPPIASVHMGLKCTCAGRIRTVTR